MAANDVDRLWVTVNGYRVPSSALRLNPLNELSILTTVVAGDDVTITSMTPSASPSQTKYINFVDDKGHGEIYRANAETTTWLTEELDQYETKIHVNDIADVTNIIEQAAVTPEAIDGTFNIGLNAQKTDILQINVFNVTKGVNVSQGLYKIQVISMVPVLRINDKPIVIEEGDNLLITIVEGNTIIINGEQIKLSGADLETNTVEIQQRGVNNTGVQKIHPKYSKVYGLLADNRLPEVAYRETWNPIPGIYNKLEGDPLQISDTPAAIFLKTDIT
jgi:hypothetical protein